MPVIKSAKKALAQAKKRRGENLRVRVQIREAIKSFKKKPTVGALSRAYSILDRAAKKNVIHKNKAARLKARLVKLV